MLLAALLLLSGGGAAAPDDSPDMAPGKLPRTVVPVHYAIALELDPKGLKAGGSEVVEIDVRKPTTRVVLNANAMTLSSATVDDGAQSASVTLDDDAETATLTFVHPLAEGRHQLRIAFTGRIGKSGPGLYAVDYRDPESAKTSSKKRLISSHFAPGDARRMFPCWDEPAFKATFALTVTLPRAFTVVGNMPILQEEPLGAVLKKVTLAPTPKMSTYLVELTAGELERLTGEVDGTSVSVVTTAGKRELGRFALESALRLLHYYNDYFGVKYPLPKLDLIAVPDGHVSAMEHWGAITFRESFLLFDPVSSPGTARRGIFTLVAHEIAHQWFGNLVTMAWWNDLWLNEGFATWMESKATEHFHPRWQTWLSNNDEKQSAMTQDARGTAHAIRQAVADESEASDMFDDITYNKAGAVVRMLEGYLGPDVLRDGVRKYIGAYAYRNATAADLWRALEASSGKPVSGIAAGFIEQPGVPLVIAELKCVDGTQRILLRQEPFTIGVAEPASRHWQIPVAIARLRGAQPVETVLVQEKPQEIAAGRCGEPVKLNSGDIGYFRVAYGAAARAALVRSFALLSPADQTNLLADTWALVRSGRAAPADYLELVEQIGEDGSRAVWEQVIRVIRRLDRLERDRPEREAFRTYMRAKLRPVLARITWDEQRPDSDGTWFLRTRLIKTLGELGDAKALAEARRRFDAFLSDPHWLQPALRDVVTRLAGIEADRRTYEMLLSLARKTRDSDERERYYVAAASARDPALARRTLDLTLTNELSPELVRNVISAVAIEGEHAELAWAFLRKHFAALVARQKSSFAEDYVPTLMKSFSDRARAQEFADFAPVHRSSDGRIAAGQAVHAIRFEADFKAQALPAIDAWIAQHSIKD